MSSVSIVLQTGERRTRFAVESVRWLSESAFVLRFDRQGLEFEPGQYLSVGPAGEIHMREYSVYSPNDADYIEILVKLVDGGYVSNRLARLKPGDAVAVDGPFGFFTIDREFLGVPHHFLATGTGISPFHALVGSIPEIDYVLLHGIRNIEEQYEYDWYHRDRITCCTSRGDGGDYRGRITDFLRESPIDPSARYYLCGNCDMIYEVFDVLQRAGVPHTNLFAEVYF